jgi:hypothetical protein
MVPSDLIKEPPARIVAKQQWPRGEPLAKAEADQAWNNQPQAGMAALEAARRALKKRWRQRLRCRRFIANGLAFDRGGRRLGLALLLAGP